MRNLSRNTFLHVNKFQKPAKSHNPQGSTSILPYQVMQDNIRNFFYQAVQHSLTKYISFHAMHGNLQKAITLPDS